MNYGKSVFAQERRLAAQQFEQNCAETVNIDSGRSIFRRGLHLFRCDIARRAEDGHRTREVACGFDPFCQAEVADHGLTARIE